MSEEETGIETKTRRWNAFVCPGCRLLFRVPKDPDGRGVVCPNCRRLMRLPQKGDEVPELVGVADLTNASAEPATGRPALSPGGGPRHHHRSHSRRSPLGRVRGKLSNNQFLLLAMSVGVVLAFVGIIALIRLVGGGVERADEQGQSMTEQALPTLQLGVLDLRPDEGDNPEISTSMTIEPGTFLPRAEAMARRFVSARKVRDILPLVRTPEVTGPRMRDWYARHDFESQGIRKFAEQGGLTFRGRMVTVPVLMDDFTKRQLAFVVDGDSLLIDWESWVGWSEMDWSDFMDQRPIEPKVFRVYATEGNYFNFGFSEDDSWRCYELESPDRKTLLFGYGKIGTEADNKLSGVEKKQRLSLTLQLSYPKNAPAANQVIINSVVANDWVVDEELVIPGP